MFPDIAEYKSDHVILERNLHTQHLKDFSFCFLELPKFNKTIDELHTMVEKWTYFFKRASNTSEADIEKITGLDIVIRQAYEALNQYSWSEQELFTYEREKKNELDAKAILAQKEADGIAKGLAKGLAEGVEKGRAEGLETGKKEALYLVVKNLLARGSSTQDIQQATGLSQVEIESLSSVESKQ